LPKKVKKLARISVLSAKAKDEQVKIMEDFTFDVAKTKDMASVISGFGLEGKRILVLVPEHDENVYLASRNIKNLQVAQASDASTYDLIGAHTLLIMEGAIEKLEGVLLS
jgi:large subunit ribosomal protein L4